MAKATVLFLCTGNSARSQMAEALLRKRAGDRFDAYSAGTEPKGMNPLTVRAMNEIGIDISGQRSKGVKEYLGRLPVDYLIVVCGDAEQNCPTTWPGMRTRMFWPFDDPAAEEGTEKERLEAFRRVRDEIDVRIRNWLREIVDPKREALELGTSS
jgi:arsenate reductase